MYAGKIAESGTMDQLYHEPRHPYTRLLFSATPDLYGDDVVVSIPGVPPRLDRPIEGCAFRARCDSAFVPCASDEPALVEVGPGHTAACHLNGLSDTERAEREGATATGVAAGAGAGVAGQP
jgi:oligopeptide/dipeptide ABC transporter ATP-binding protein